MGVTIKDNKRDDRNRKVTLNLFVLCFCYILCTLPHVIYSYFDHNNNNLYDFLLGFYWLQYGFNIALYVSQRAQYWNAYKLYIREKIIPRCKKPTMEPSEPSTTIRAWVRFMKPKIDRSTLQKKVLHVDQLLRIDADYSGEPEPNITWMDPHGNIMKESDR